ncbi:MAG TPA: biotin--[acetyl-CoA-carboxylase] ligase [Deltaproteobacteria bacterium]|nr:biotin--[acetyl-CoA-carboxylase] ligase [Deltaproteobacteria bacterium]
MAVTPFPAIVQEVVDLLCVSSTNTLALDSDRAGLLVTASEQTEGRGRNGRSWFSPPGANLYATLTVGIADPRLSLVAGAAIREALAGVAGNDFPVEIKWPNDLIVQGRKICGILCEARKGITAVGMGINVNQTAWPAGLESKATSLALVMGREVPKELVLHRAVEALDRWLALFTSQGFGPVRRNYLKHGLLKTHELLTEDGVPCSIVDLNEDGHLLINAAGALRELASGSILIR